MNPGQAYRRLAAQSVSQLHLVVALYEQVIADLKRALAAHEHGQIEARTHEIDHALVVIGYLQGTLDLERGGDVARNLEQFYNLLRASLLRTNNRSFSTVMDKQISNLLMLRQAWAQLDAGGAQTTGPSSTHWVAPEVAGSESPSQDWKA
jgi:flagellar protein FliS